MGMRAPLCISHTHPFADFIAVTAMLRGWQRPTAYMLFM
jgi:hypothetical protein